MRLAGKQLPVAGGYDENGQLTIDPAKFQSADLTDAVIDAIAADVAASEPAEPGREVRCPGMGEHRSRKENMELGIPVAEEKWAEVLAM